MSKKKSDSFNPAFGDLPYKIKSISKVPVTPPIKASEPDGSVFDDERYFLDAMSDVTPLIEEKRKAMPNISPNSHPAHPAPDEVRETLAYLNGLVKGVIDMDITFSDEYMEGSVKGLSQKIMKRLKKGQIPYQDYIDLHGLTREGAEIKVRDFLLQSHKCGLRCLLIVHGRGRNSPDSFPVLKEMLPIWLNRGPIKKIVLAFATAQPYDGGTGAIYVLLKKRRSADVIGGDKIIYHRGSQ
ncbi:MAG: Smr/MutS family protein [Pseudomonadota bacterium]